MTSWNVNNECWASSHVGLAPHGKREPDQRVHGVGDSHTLGDLGRCILNSTCWRMRANTPPSAARPMHPATSIRTRRRARATCRCQWPKPGCCARVGSGRGHEPQAAGASYWGSDPAPRCGPVPTNPPDRPGQVARCSRSATCGSTGQITWGWVDLDAEGARRSRSACDRRRCRQARSARALRRRPCPRRDRRRTRRRPKILVGSGSTPPVTASARGARSRGSSSSTPPTAGDAGGVAVVATARLRSLRRSEPCPRSEPDHVRARSSTAMTIRARRQHPARRRPARRRGDTFAAC